MNPKIELTSLAISKLRNDQNSFVKYDIEAALDELENTETDVKLKYKFVILSNPTNTKISVEGIATIFTNQSELPKYLGLDEKQIPYIVNIIYQEIFPLFYVVSKSMQIPCPAYRLSQMSAPPKPEANVASDLLEVQEPLGDKDVIKSPDPKIITDEQIKTEQQPQEQVIETRL